MTTKSLGNYLSENGTANITSALDHIGLRLVATVRRILNPMLLSQEESQAIKKI